jgi:hypothetical protein
MVVACLRHDCESLPQEMNEVVERPGPMGSRSRARARSAQVVLAAMLLLAGGSAARAEDTGSAAALQAAYAKHRAEMAHNKFGVPLRLESRQTSDTLQGDIHALLDQPFDKVESALATPQNWCDILILHPNVRKCRSSTGGSEGAPSLSVGLGRNELPVEFSYHAAKAPQYLDVRLEAPTGPLGTTDYRIRLEAAPADAGHTILHLTYSHRYGLRARLAMQAYFSTLGRGKVGFTVVGRDPQGQPIYIGDLRGGLERNAMRYYASIESYLFSLDAPPGDRLEKRLRHWYAYTERYPLQLEERAGYLDDKRSEAREMHTQG